jgi:hypothetical protein
MTAEASAFRLAGQFKNSMDNDNDEEVGGRPRQGHTINHAAYLNSIVHVSINLLFQRGLRFVCTYGNCCYTASYGVAFEESTEVRLDCVAYRYLVQNSRNTLIIWAAWSKPLLWGLGNWISLCSPLFF